MSFHKTELLALYMVVFLFMVNIAQERNVWKTAVNAIYRWAHEQKKETRFTALKFRLTCVRWHHKRTICIQISTSLSLLLSLQFSQVIFLHLQWSKVSLSYMCKSSISLSTTSFHVLLSLPLCMAPSTSKLTHFSLNHHHRFLEHVHTIAIYFFRPFYYVFYF